MVGCLKLVQNGLIFPTQEKACPASTSYSTRSSDGKLLLVTSSTLLCNLPDRFLPSLVENVNTPDSWKVEAFVFLQPVQAIKSSLRQLFDSQIACNARRRNALRKHNGVALDGPAREESTCRSSVCRVAKLTRSYLASIPESNPTDLAISCTFGSSTVRISPVELLPKGE